MITYANYPYILFSIFLIQTVCLANPYYDPDKVPKDRAYTKPFTLALSKPFAKESYKQSGALDVIRVQVDWSEKSDSFSLGSVKVEKSGTAALYKRAKHKDNLGSFLGILKNSNTGKELFYDSVGTGQEYRRLTRALTFRFPYMADSVIFEFWAENSKSGILEKVFSAPIDQTKKNRTQKSSENILVKSIKKASKQPSITIGVYAEGYAKDGAERFWKSAASVGDTLNHINFPMLERIEIIAVFAPSKTPLGAATDLGLPVQERDSFLGLYYPYWRNFGRWYHVVYPTRESKFRDGLAQIAYDYPVVLVDSTEYWGVGNFKAFTAIPANDSHFDYLLTHEFGHFFGLNEEYEGGGPTELAFAPEIDEPWSQNITFLRDRSWSSLKWNKHVDQKTPLPTPDKLWWSWGINPNYGAYQGGYGDTDPLGTSHKPGFECVMERYENFCPICLDAVIDRLKFDLGE